MKKTLLKIFLPTIAILIFRLVSIPPFDPPDEQSHLSQVHFFLTEGRMPNTKDKNNLSAEAAFAERIIGTMSDGENKYFFHPEYRYEMVDSFDGKFEAELEKHNNSEERSTYITYQSSTYPPLYYWFTSIFYKLVNGQNFFTRLYISRFASLLITMFLPLIAFYFARLVWQDKLLQLTLPFMVLMFPMTTFLGVAINSDNLHFLLFGIAMLLMATIIKKGLSSKLTLWLGIIIGLDFLTKPQAYILLPILFLAILLKHERSDWKVLLRQLSYLLIPVILLAGWQEIPKLLPDNQQIISSGYFASEINYGGIDNFIIYLRGYLHTHFSEIIVWYWGVFKWSGVILPRPFWWIANRLLGLSFIGIILRLFRDYRAHRLSTTSRLMIFSLISNLIYIVAIMAFDWQFYQEFGHSLGLQARYYLPLLIPQMFILLSGLLEFGWNKNIKNWIARGIIVFFLALHLGSVFVQLGSYYDFLPISTFFHQISQYKPVFAKGSWWYLWIPLYFTGIISLTRFALRKGKEE